MMNRMLGRGSAAFAGRHAAVKILMLANRIQTNVEMRVIRKQLFDKTLKKKQGSPRGI